MSRATVGLRPPRKVFDLTPEGRQVVETWLRSPVDHMRKVRPDFLLKLYFLRQLDPAGEGALVLRQIEVCEALREKLARRVGSSSGFDQLVAASKLSTVEATVRWLQEYAAELQKNDPRDKGLAKGPPVDVLA